MTELTLEQVREAKGETLRYLSYSYKCGVMDGFDNKPKDRMDPDYQRGLALGRACRQELYEG